MADHNLDAGLAQAQNQLHQAWSLADHNLDRTDPQAGGLREISRWLRPQADTTGKKFQGRPGTPEGVE